MSGKSNGTSKEPFVMLPRDLVRSDAWRSLGINARRFIDFLIGEHLSHGGKNNGKLKAPRRQLHSFGISARHVSAAIQEVEEKGLVGCNRGGLRVATTYALTWLETFGHGKPTNRWRSYRDPELTPLPQPKNRNLVSEGKSALVSEGKSDSPNLVSEGKSDRPKSLVSEGKHLSRKDSTRGGTITSELSVEDERLSWSAPVLVELLGPESDAVLAWAAQ